MQLTLTETAPQVLDTTSLSRSTAARLMAAALTLPGVLLAPQALAESAPENAVVSIKYLDYRDSQPSGARMHVTSPSVVVIAPIGSRWAVEAGIVTDAMSGASPVYHSTLSGASGKGVRDDRKAGDLKLTHYFDRGAVGIAAAISTENDYFSRTLSFDARLNSEDNNTTLALGFGGSADRINSENRVAENEMKRSREFLIGITQVLSPTQLVQSNITVTRGKGYFSDPYKPFDTRPNTRNSVAWLTRYNHYFSSVGGALNSSYRFYHDSFGIDSHTLELTWRQPLAESWTLSPMLRYATQSAADFYFDPPWPKGYVNNQLYSADQRLSAFGSISYGLRVDKALGNGWSVNAKAELTEQRGSWRLGGGGSVGLEPFRSQTFIVGVSKTL
jgi:Protein of unknown function (DUF3570)